MIWITCQALVCVFAVTQVPLNWPTPSSKAGDTAITTLPDLPAKDRLVKGRGTVNVIGGKFEVAYFPFPRVGLVSFDIFFGF